MSCDEFAFIRDYFTDLNAELSVKAESSGLLLGTGDDAALLKMSGTYALTSDTMIEGVHFFKDCDPYLLGRRVLDVNFSDLYAMGALPAFVLLSLNVPADYMADSAFWKDFSSGFAHCLADHDCSLIGGNTCKAGQDHAPLSISITAVGRQAEDNRDLRRSAAKDQDLIVCTGFTGSNALYVDAVYSGKIALLSEEERKTAEKTACSYDKLMKDFVPRLVRYASCAIDVSDGFLGDLSHILVQSGCTAEVDASAMPLDPLMLSQAEKMGYDRAQMLDFALTGGGDYNLLFTLPEENFKQLAEECPVKLSVVGRVHKAALSAENFLATDCSRISVNGVTAGMMGSYNHFS